MGFIVIYLLYFFIFMFLSGQGLRNVKFYVSGFNNYVFGRVRVSKLKFTVLV